MAWKFDKPLVTLTTEDQNEKARELWEEENLGGIIEDNNRLPQPVVGLLLLTILTAFLVTAPLWGSRPTAAIYEDYIKMMDTDAVKAIKDDTAKMEYLVSNVKDSKYKGLQDRHPVEMDDLRVIKDQVVELQNSGKNLEEYIILGPEIVLANFQGNCRGEDGMQIAGKSRNCENGRVALQPYWDLGYTIDLFYVTYFCLAVIIAVKRLPNFKWQPTHESHGYVRPKAYE